MTIVKKEWNAIGLMSGTSLDGLDITFCRFIKVGKGWNYEVVGAETVAYSKEMRKKLANLMAVDAENFAAADAHFGQYSGEKVKKFLSKHKLKVDFIASHGHTIFHQPKNGFTTQIGNGAYIHAETGIPVISDFRSVDVALKGQGAPLVPIGDKLLFGEYTYCLNLGGIANISYDKKGKRIAGDICPVNLLLNKLAEAKGKAYDKDGLIASKGKVNKVLLEKLNKHPFYKKAFPKSLGRELIEKDFFTVLDKTKISIEDKMATVCEHIAVQLISSLESKGSLLITGGGAFNCYLIDRIRELAGNKIQLIVPNAMTVSYKEAIIFAFLGLKRVLGEPNALCSVTGASNDSVGGALYGVIK